MRYEEIFEYNEKWIREKLDLDPDFFTKLSKEQKPEFLFIGCSDSRANPGEITGLTIGKAFVHRNVANIVNPIDLNVASVIQYGIENLKIKHIIVCGHYGCGGVKAAMEEVGLGKNSPWLQVVKNIRRIHKKELDHIRNIEKRYDRLVELNVIEQSLNVYQMDCVRSLAGTENYPTIHGWVYDIRTGRLVDLNIDPDGISSSGKKSKEPMTKKLLSFFKLNSKEE